MSPHSKTPRRPGQLARQRLAKAQLSLVEHALCPLDVKDAFTTGLAHDYSYFFIDKNRNTKGARVRVACPFGLSPNDEFYLWSLLHLTLTQDQPTPEFIATPHYCLRQLGIVHKGADQQKRYDTFRHAIQRLAGVVYQNDRFYDPVKGEHRNVSFGLMKYSLPLDSESSRAWRFVWDQQFFAFSQALRGSFQFDLDLYRELDCATRRLFLLLAKVFWRRESLSLDVAHLAVNVLGFSCSIPVADLKIKVRRCADKLLARRVIRLPQAARTTKSLFTKRAKGKYNVAFMRGPYFDEPPHFNRKTSLSNSPCYDPLRTIGFTDQAIGRILHQYKPTLVHEWADITLAAVERKIVNKDPKAFFYFYIREAANKRTTPPDWWRELRRREERKRWEEQRQACPIVADAMSGSTTFAEAFDKYLRDEAKAVFDSVTSQLFKQIQSTGPSDLQARQSAERFARQHLRNRFIAEHPEFRPDQ